VGRILPAARELALVRSRRIPTAQVNETLRRIVSEHPPPSGRGRRPARVFYATQTGARPPTFAVFSNRPESLEGNYARFLRNRLQQDLGFRGVPVRVILRKREGAPKE
jgi:GTP-binding protein